MLIWKFKEYALCLNDILISVKNITYRSVCGSYKCWTKKAKKEKKRKSAPDFVCLDFIFTLLLGFAFFLKYKQTLQTLSDITPKCSSSHLLWVTRVLSHHLYLYFCCCTDHLDVECFILWYPNQPHLMMVWGSPLWEFPSLLSGWF